jgi:hypothetical protein
LKIVTYFSCYPEIKKPPKEKKALPWRFHIGTFLKLRLILYSRRLEVKLERQLGTRAMWREVVGANGSYELRESLTSYEDDFGPKKVDLTLENAFYWNISF